MQQSYETCEAVLRALNDNRRADVDRFAISYNGVNESYQVLRLQPGNVWAPYSNSHTSMLTALLDALKIRAAALKVTT